MSVILTEVTSLIEWKICPKHIKFDISEEEQNKSKINFYKSGFPGVVGCVDGTHVHISAPEKELQHLYINRKGFFSINALMVCDFNMNITYVDATPRMIPSYGIILRSRKLSRISQEKIHGF
ncbi:PREDICTED: putative nuclease HARBI1 [Rhagoletis zephyria]|uniref:putative nuclease HARBI1 n=1 Tax=Rhagoletis zephyria TaxID=28612 RepID=UPI00081130A3|nr:PREDICTED: putative nuclease HARBI1 [Rhagoletis zephyria]